MNYLNLTCPPLPFYVSGGRETYAPETCYSQPVSCDFFHLIYVQHGDLHFTQDGMPITLTSGQYYISVPDKSIVGTTPCSEQTDIFWIRFITSPRYSLSANRSPEQNESSSSDDLQPQIFSVCLRRHGTIEEADRPYFEKQLHHLSMKGHTKYVQMRYQADQSAQHFERQIAFIRLLLILYSQRYPLTAHQNIAEIVHDYINQHYSEDISLKELAKQHRYSSSHVIRCFNEAYGISPIQYLKQVRIQKAMKLLSSTDMSVQDAGHEVGFHIPSYFIRQFKKETSLTPLQFRIRYRETQDSNE